MTTQRAVLTSAFSLFCVAIYLLSTPKTLADETCAGPFQAIFIIDSSSSVGNNGYVLERQGVYDCICGPDAFVPTDGTLWVSVIQFSNGVTQDQAQRIDLTLIDSADSLNNFCTKLLTLPQMTPQGTNTQAAIGAAEQMFAAFDATSGTPVSDRVVILSTDGVGDDPNAAVIAAESLRTMPVPVRICTVGFSDSPPCNVGRPFLTEVANSRESPKHNPAQREGTYSCASSASEYVPICQDCLYSMLHRFQPDCDRNGVTDIFEQFDIRVCCDPVAGTCTLDTQCGCEATGGIFPSGEIELCTGICIPASFEPCSVEDPCPDPNTCFFSSGFPPCQAAACCDNVNGACIGLNICIGGADAGDSCIDDSGCDGLCSNTDPFFPDFCEADSECWHCQGGDNEGALCPLGGSECTGVGGMCDMTSFCDLGTCPLECPQGTESQSSGSRCDQNCCEQPLSWPGGDICSNAAVQMITVPPFGSGAETVTISGDNSAVTFDISPCNYRLDSTGLIQDRGWWEAFQINECAQVTIDFCCTEPRFDPLWRILYDSCPCGEALFSTGADNSTCSDGNSSVTFGPLPAGTYYYPIYSAPDGHVGQYQLHITAEACPLAACCHLTCDNDGQLCASDSDCQRCAGGARDGLICDCPNSTCNSETNLCVGIGGACDPSNDCGGGGTCTGTATCAPTCDFLDEIECSDAGGYWLSADNLPEGVESPAACDSSTCDTGSCCSGPGVCEDRRNPAAECTSTLTCMDKTTCDSTGGVYVGGAKCDYPGLPCPVCELSGDGSCQTDVGVFALLSRDPAVVARADDFVAGGQTIGQVCVAGAYLREVPMSEFNAYGLEDCDDEITADFFSVTVYTDYKGLPLVQVGTRSAMMVKLRDANVLPFNVPFDLWQFQLTLDVPIAGLVPGNWYWIEIVNNPTASPGCDWHWAPSLSGGNDYSVGKDAGTYGPEHIAAADLYFCLDINAQIGLQSDLDRLVHHVLLVDLSSPSGDDGLTWATAFDHLQDALRVAADPRNRINEIWVAQGTYKPDQGIDITSGDREATFKLLDGVAVYGGFLGNAHPDGGETACFQRDQNPNTNLTILSGDISGNDLPGEFPNGSSFSENSYHVVTASGTDDSVVLDGFTITGGNADLAGVPPGTEGHSAGAGLLNLGGSPTLQNCRFIDNEAIFTGGGIYSASNGSPHLVNCAFSGNHSQNGGAIYGDTGTLTMINCKFIGNSAIFAGGAVYLIDASGSMLTNCLFQGNWTTLQPGELTDGSTGGAIYHNRSSPTLTNCTLSGNSAANTGGVYNPDNGPNYHIENKWTMTNCILWGNTATLGTVQSAQIDGGVPTVTYSCVQDELADGNVYPGTGNIDDDPMFRAPNDLHLSFGSLCIDAGNNDADTQAGVPGIQPLPVTDLDGNPRIVDGDGDQEPPGVFATVDMGAYEHDGRNPLFVDTTATGGTASGADWLNAYVNVQDALAAAVPGDEIWVAAGVYPPVVGCAPNCDRTASFQLKEGVALFGGFPGGGGIYDRDPVAQKTVLSGDLNSDDVGGLADASRNENSYHVVTAGSIGATAILGGFTITGGNANGPGPENDKGGGIQSLGASPTVVQCTIAKNSAILLGGGMYNTNDSPVLIQTSFLGNSAGSRGGALYTVAGNPTLTDCLFTGNSAMGPVGDGFGGAIYNSAGGPSLINCTFSENSAPFGEGGGMRNEDGSTAVLTNCILWGNTDSGPADASAQISDDINSTSLVMYSCVQDDDPDDPAYPGTGNIDEAPEFVDADGADDIVGTQDDDLHLYASSPCIEAGDNSVVTVATDLDGNPRLQDADGDGEPTVDMGVYEFTCLTAAIPHAEILDGELNPKNRYISVTAGTAGRSQAIRVRFVNLPPPFDIWEHDHPQRVGPGDYFVGAPFQVCENSGNGRDVVAPDDCDPAGPVPRQWFWAAPLECDSEAAHFMDWRGFCNAGICDGGLNPGSSCIEDADCTDVVHLFHEGFVPDGVYDVQVVDSSCSLQEEGSFSAPLTMTQAVWGDICSDGPGGACTGPADGELEVIQDVLGIIDKFQNINSLQKARADLVPGDDGIHNGPDFKVTIIGDALFALDAFQGFPYPFTPGDPCVPGPPRCGNGTIDPDEDCDGGPGCTDDCLCDPDFEPTDPPSPGCQPICGNGRIDPDEECDGGLDCTACICNAGYEPTAPPSIDCQPTCGNGSIDPGEQCDPPGSTGDCSLGEVCQADCTCPSPSSE